MAVDAWWILRLWMRHLRYFNRLLFFLWENGMNLKLWWGFWFSWQFVDAWLFGRESGSEDFDKFLRGGPRDTKVPSYLVLKSQNHINQFQILTNLSAYPHSSLYVLPHTPINHKNYRRHSIIFQELKLDLPFPYVIISTIEILFKVLYSHCHMTFHI